MKVCAIALQSTGDTLAGWVAPHPLVGAALDQALQRVKGIEIENLRVLSSLEPHAVTIGLVRPKICLSFGLLHRLSEAEVHAVWLHEQAHVRAKDPLRLAAVHFLSNFLWFLPVVRSLTDAFRGVLELRSDQAAISSDGKPLELASAIVEIAKGMSSKPLLVPALSGLPLVEARVARLLGREVGTPSWIPRGQAILSATMLVGFLGILIGPTLGTDRRRPADPMAAMHSQMRAIGPYCLFRPDMRG